MEKVGFDGTRLLARRAQQTLGAEYLAKLFKDADPTRPAPVNFAAGEPDPRLYPTETVIQATAEVLRREGPAPLNYGPRRGYTPLVEAVASLIERREGARPRPEELMITSGSSQGMSIVAEVFLDPGDIMVLEAPSFCNMIWVGEIREARMVTVPFDEQGMRTDLLAATLTRLEMEGRKPKLIYALPTFHNPGGVTMSLERRIDLVRVAEEHGILILEDDAYYDLRYSGQNLPTLHSLDRAGLVIGMGTFSKLLAPGVRLGWLNAPRPIMDRLLLFKQDLGSAPLAAAITAEFVRQHLDGHLPGLLSAYRAKRDALLSALERELAGVVTWTVPDGGYYVWVQLPPGLDGLEVTQAADREGVAIVPGSIFFPDGAGGAYFRISFSYPALEEIPEGVARLARAIKGLL